MKSKFTDKLFEKQIDLKSSGAIMGGQGDDTSEYSTSCSNNGTDTVTYCWGEDGKRDETYEELTPVDSCE